MVDIKENINKNFKKLMIRKRFMALKEKALRDLKASMNMKKKALTMTF